MVHVPCLLYTSEHGGIGMIEKNGKLVGSFFFAKEETYEIREPLLKKGEEEAPVSYTHLDVYKRQLEKKNWK